jgi:hypothetical protein
VSLKERVIGGNCNEYLTVIWGKSGIFSACAAKAPLEPDSGYLCFMKIELSAPHHIPNMQIITFFTCIVLLLGSPLAAQDLAANDVPAAVTSGLKTKFPEASDVTWKKNKSGKYEADFRLSGKKAEAKFLADGKWDSSERRVEVSQLPAPAGDYIKKNFAAYKIDWVKWQEEADAVKNRYEVKVKKDKADMELVFDEKGKFLKKKDKKSA